MRHSTITTETKRELQDNEATQAKEWVSRCICPRPWRRAHFARSLLACHHLWDWAVSTRLDASSYLTSRNCTWSKQQGTSASFTPLRAPSTPPLGQICQAQTAPPLRLGKGARSSALPCTGESRHLPNSDRGKSTRLRPCPRGLYP